jgi:hypothetical protein
LFPEEVSKFAGCEDEGGTRVSIRSRNEMNVGRCSGAIDPFISVGSVSLYVVPAVVLVSPIDLPFNSVLYCTVKYHPRYHPPSSVNP